MAQARRVLFALCRAALGVYTLAIGSGAGLYGVLAVDQLAEPTGGLGAGLGAAGALLMSALLSTGAVLSALVFAMTLRRWQVARLAAPLPALAGSTGWGAWLWSGDPGDEAWLWVALALSVSCFAVCAASAAVGFPSAARDER